MLSLLRIRGPLTSMAQVSRIRGSYNNVDSITVLFICAWFGVTFGLMLVPQLWPGTLLANAVTVAMRHDILIWVSSAIGAASGYFLPFDLKRKRWRPYYAAIIHYERANGLLQRYSTDRSSDHLAEASFELQKAIPLLGNVPEVAQFADKLRQLIDKEFPR